MSPIAAGCGCASAPSYPAGVRHVAQGIGYADTAANRRALAPRAALVGAAIAAGKQLDEIRTILSESLAGNRGAAPENSVPPEEPPPTGPTVEQYYEI